MCEDDWAEISCQFSPVIQAQDVAELCFLGEAWVARVVDRYGDAQPVEAFGLTMATYNVGNAWAFGTARRVKAIPAVTRFIRQRVKAWINRGVTRVEARSAATHQMAHRWLIGLGGETHRLPQWGRNGEEFVLFSWTAETWESQRNAA